MSCLAVSSVFSVIAAFMPFYGPFMMARFCAAVGIGGALPTGKTKGFLKIILLIGNNNIFSNKLLMRINAIERSSKDSWTLGSIWCGWRIVSWWNCN